MRLIIRVNSGVFEIIGGDAIDPSFLSTASFREQLDELGTQSGVAQELKGPITTYEKLLQSDQHTIILEIDNSNASAPHIIGYLKYGCKNLYFYTKGGSMKQYENALCLLDFYVLESQQRHGIGKRLFDTFLQVENVQPNVVAYDRPSRKLLPFLARHYNLTGPDHQPNRYTIYNGFLK